MILDDGAADRQPHAQASRFGGVERVEDPLHRLRVEPDARIAHGHAHPLGLGSCSDHQLARVVLRVAHGLDPVHDEIQHDLLNQYPIAPHRREIAG